MNTFIQQSSLNIDSKLFNFINDEVLIDLDIDKKNSGMIFLKL